MGDALCPLRYANSPVAQARWDTLSPVRAVRDLVIISGDFAAGCREPVQAARWRGRQAAHGT